MCFSTAASFGAGVVLTGIGLVAASKVTQPEQRLFAAIPAIFAIQQFAEGFVWVSLLHESYAPWARPTAFLFLFFAEVLWPLWVPLAMLQLEQNGQRKKILLYLSGFGLVFALHTLYYLMTNRFDAQIGDYHIKYYLHFPLPFTVLSWIAYGTLTILPFFLSTVPRMWLVAVPMALAFLLAKMLFPNYVISVWCFFAAILSVVVVLELAVMRRGSELFINGRRSDNPLTPPLP